MATLADRSHSPSTAAGSTARAHRGIVVWLLICCAVVFAIVVVGGVTRLTHSGLSITEWQPIVGTLPPLSDADWSAAFSKYQLTPEYQQVNKGMSLGDFQRIFWWEYFHRLLGRLVGVVFLLPFLWFLARREIPPGYGIPFAVIFALGAAQGALGWYMVQSGLVADPRVSQFRLTAHLGLAFLIFAAMFWAALSLLAPQRADRDVDNALSSIRRFALAVACLVFLQALSGGMVAGIRAGFAYNTFPLMNGAIVPAEILSLDPAWKNFFYNMATVQFVHRVLALLLAFAVPLLWWNVVRGAARVPPRATVGAHLLLAMLAVQVTLGILTLVLVVPLPLAALHQAGALLLFAFALNLVHALR
jgi:cytochrome c oxidase assembly protein subunit 15